MQFRLILLTIVIFGFSGTVLAAEDVPLRAPTFNALSAEAEQVEFALAALGHRSEALSNISYTGEELTENVIVADGSRKFVSKTTVEMRRSG